MNPPRAWTWTASTEEDYGLKKRRVQIGKRKWKIELVRMTEEEARKKIITDLLKIFL
jgi:hypothetical protein